MKKQLTVFCIMGLILFGCQPSHFEKMNFSKEINDGWELFSSEDLTVSGEVISTDKFSGNNIYKIDIPATVMAGLVQNGEYKDLYFGKNLENVDNAQFQIPWWYRKKFDFDKKENYPNVYLFLEGVNYRANIWLNGTKIGSSENIEQPFRMFNIDIKKQIKEKNNILAIEVIPPQKDDLTIGFVDWNPAPPDNNMGLWRGIKLIYSKDIEITNTFVNTELDLKTFKSASLIISTEVTNNSDKIVKTIIEGSIEDITFKKEIELGPNSIKTINFSEEEFPQLVIQNPKVWWPNGYGAQPLYNLNLTAKINDQISSAENVRFGIRDIEDYINENGYRGYKVNGKKILIKSGGWVDDMLLSDSDNKVKAQLNYVKNMNLNSIRLEGFWGKNKTIFDTADELGILIMIGWSCQWEWEGYCGRPEEEFMMINEDEYELHAQAYLDQVKWIRNNPSVFLWVFGSDRLIPTALEQMLVDKLKIEDPTRPVLSTCKGGEQGGTDIVISEVTGDPAVKMLGPYGYVTPNYWYLDKNNGGAYGFNTETGPGPQVPPIESIKKMIPENDLWPINDMWNYHCGRNSFNSLDRYLKAFNSRYGKSDSAEDFAQVSQISNYEAMRAMYEAFQVNRYNATGVVQWMLNSAWPEMFWQLYDYYLMPNGAFYGAKNGCRTVNIIYNYGDKSIYLSNELFENLNDLNVSLKLFDINSEILLEKNVEVNIEANKSELIIEIPEIKNLPTTYFLYLELLDSDTDLIADNFYWLSNKADVIDFENTEWFYTPNKSYADFKDLRKMPKTNITTETKVENSSEGYSATVTYKNESDKIAFFIETLIVDKKSGESILPVYLSDNYISLLPGKSKNISVKIDKEDLDGKIPV